MGFGDWLSGVVNKVKDTAGRVGSWISEKATPIIGKVSGIARTIGNAINSNVGQSILDAASALPIPGIGTVTSLIRRGGRLASTIGDIGQTAEKVSGGVSQLLQGNLGGVGQTFREGRQLANEIQDARGRPQYNSAVLDRVQQGADYIGNRYGSRMS